MYELAFHLTPDLEAADVSARVSDIQQIITAAGGTIAGAKEPKRIHLSYPIAHKYYGYFTVLDIDCPPDAVFSIESQLKLQPTVLRFLTTKKPPAGKQIKTLAIQRIVRVKPTMGTRKSEDGAKKPATQVEEKQMEVDLVKELEKI